MKILFVNTLFPPNIVGGAEKSIYLLVQSLVGMGHDVAVVSGSATGHDQFLEKDRVRMYYSRQVDVRWLVTDHYPPKLRRIIGHFVDIYNVRASKAVGDIIDQERPDVIHCNNLHGFSVGVWRQSAKRGVPVVHTLRDYYLLCPPASMFKKGRSCNRQCLSCALLSFPKKVYSGYVDAVVGNSRFILDRHLSYGYFKNVKQRHVIYNAAKVPPVVDEKLLVNRKDSTLTIGYIGRVDKRKGIELLLNCARGLPKNKFTLVVAGKGSAVYLDTLTKEYSDLPVKFKGYTDAVTFYHSIDVLVVPSLWHEPLSRTILEAFAHGVPVVGSNRGGTPEVIQDRETGFTFDCSDERLLLNILKRIIEDRKILEEMKPKVLEKSRQFSTDRLVQLYMNVYMSMVST